MDSPLPSSTESDPYKGQAGASQWWALRCPQCVQGPWLPEEAVSLPSICRLTLSGHSRQEGSGQWAPTGDPRPGPAYQGLTLPSAGEKAESGAPKPLFRAPWRPSP